MAEMTRRGLVGSALGAAAGAGLVAPASGAEPQGEPAALRGAVQDGKVSLPPLHQASEQNGPVPNPMPPGKRLGICVVGLGALALENIIPGFAEAKSVRLTGLVSGEPDKARAIAAQYGVPSQNVYSYANFDSIRNNPDIDIVYIVLPNAMHAEYTVRAAQAGKHVLCEKPMASNVADAQHMVDACRAARRELMIAYRLQYNEAHRTAIGLARDKTFGRVQMIEAINGQNDAREWPMAPDPRNGRRRFAARCRALLLQRLSLSHRRGADRGDRRAHPTEERPALSRDRGRRVVHPALSVRHHRHRLIRLQLHESRQLRVHAEAGWFGLDPAFGYDNLALQISRKAGQASALEQRRFAPRSQFAVEMDAFAASLREGTTPHTPGEEGLQDMRILEAIYQAAAGGSPVKLASVQQLDATRGPWPKALGPAIPTVL